MVGFHYYCCKLAWLDMYYGLWLCWGTITMSLTSHTLVVSVSFHHKLLGLAEGVSFSSVQAESIGKKPTIDKL